MGLLHLAPDDGVAVRARQAAVRDARVAAGHAELQRLAGQEGGPLAALEVHVRVEDPQVEVRGHGAEARAEDDLQDRREAVGLQLVAPRGFGGLQGYRARLLHARHALRPVGPGRGRRLQRVVQDLRVRGRLHGVHVQGRDLRLAERLVDDVLHGRAVGRREGGAPAALVGGGAHERPQEVPALVNHHLVVDLARHGLQQQRDGALAPHEALAGGVVGEDAAHAGEPAAGGAVDEEEGAEHQAPALAEGEGDGLPPARAREVGAGEVHGHQRRGRLDVYADARALEAVDEGEAAAGDTAATAADAAGRAVLLREAPLRGRGVGDVHAAPGVHDVRDLVAVADQRLVTCLHGHSVARVHARRLRAGDSEERVVEELRAIDEGAVPAVGLVPLPALWVRVVGALVVVAHDGDLLDVVRAGGEGVGPGHGLVGGALLDGGGPHGDVLADEARVVHDELPVAREGRARLLSGEAFLVLPDLVLGPLLQRLAARRHVDLGVVPVLAGPVVLLVEAAEAVGLAHGGEAVGQCVRAEHDHGPGLHADPVPVALVVEGLELQGALVRAQGPDAHEPVVGEDGDPLGAGLLVQVRALRGGHARLMQDAHGPRLHLHLHAREVGRQHRAVACHLRVEAPHALAVVAVLPVRRGELEVRDARRACYAQEALQDLLGRLGKAALLVDGCDVLQRALQLLGVDAGADHAEALDREGLAHG
mmetsp:Transcript_38261/g.121580  ORF Transcript_38261/g.121580 Transcript_38261/m.121580 type:complete len:707 (-) Transcript_38261:152-2272(-)